jgi:flagellar biosynthesis/type III secretory pathway M-ring protein FliF/YscJ
MSGHGCDPKNSKKPELRPGTAGKAVSRAELEALRQKTADLVSQKPDKAAVILHEWVNRPSHRPASRKKAG